MSPPPRARSLLATLWAIAALLIVARPGSTPSAAAQDVGVVFDCEAYFETLYLSPGLTLGGAVDLEGEDSTPAMVLGGELSLVYLDTAQRGIYYGLVLEGVYDWQRDAARMMVGAVLGWRYIGIDGGFLASFEPGRSGAGGSVRRGGALRVFVAVGVLAVYARYGDYAGGESFVDFGALFKLPLPVWAP